MARSRSRWILTLGLCGALSHPVCADNFFGDPTDHIIQGNAQSAARSLQRRAAGGDVPSQFALAHLYRSGTGVAKDMSRSAELYIAAAKAGHVEAQYMAGVCYERGLGVRKDLNEAKAWYERAARAEDDAAAARLRELNAEAPPANKKGLFELVDEGRVAALSARLAEGEGVAERDSLDATLLHRAVGLDNTEVVAVLIANGADVNARDRNGNTPLHLAAARQNHSLVQQLLSAGASDDVTNDHGWTPQQLLTRRDAAPARGRKLDAASRRTAYLDDPRFAGWPLLSIAAWQNDLAVLEELIGTAETDERDADGYTPLARAVEADQLQAAARLLKAGANPASATVPVILLATAAQNPDMISLLTQHGANPDRQGPGGATALVYALDAGYDGIALRLLDHGADPNITDAQGASPMMKACQGGDRSVIRRLLEKGADVDATDPMGRTALHLAARHCQTAAIEELIAAGASIRPDDEGQWPLHFSAECGSVASLALLLKSGHEVDVVSGLNNTALAIAAANGHYEAARYLLAHKADPDTRDQRSNTPLHTAIHAGDDAMVELLIQGGANPRIRNGNELSAFDLAKGNKRLTEVLKREQKSLAGIFD